METIDLNIALEFSKTPGPRNRSEGSFSGEEFRESILNGRFEQVKTENKKLIINLDGTFGYGTSFLEEAFGGLARNNTEINILNYIDFVSEEEPYLVDDIKGYINDIGSGS